MMIMMHDLLPLFGEGIAAFPAFPGVSFVCEIRKASGSLGAMAGDEMFEWLAQELAQERMELDPWQAVF